MTLKYSIIIPCYKETDEDLRKCLNHIKNQSKQPYEVIVVNDCGFTHFEEIVKEYNFKYIYNKTNLDNGGARNVGIREATGDYLIFCNADDYFDTNTIEELDKVNNGEDLILVGVKAWTKVGYVDFEVIPNEHNTPYFSKCECFGEPMHIVNRKFILDNDLFELEFIRIADVDWCVRLEQAIKSYTYVPKTLYYWQVGHKRS